MKMSRFLKKLDLSVLWAFCLYVLVKTVPFIFAANQFGVIFITQDARLCIITLDCFVENSRRLLEAK